MPAWGSVYGPVYPLGKITVTTAGTPIALNINVPVIDKTGTNTPLKCAKIKVMADPGNTAAKSIYLIFTGQAAAASSGTSVCLQVPPGQERTLETANLEPLFSVDKFSLDADVNGLVAFVTLVMV